MSKEPTFLSHRGYLLAAITHLALNEKFWSRSLDNLAMETGLEKDRLKKTLDSFISIFRKHKTQNDGEMYSLHLRYACRKNTDRGSGVLTVSDVPPLEKETFQSLIDWVARSAAEERSQFSQSTSNKTAIVAAILAAVAAVTAAGFSIYAPTPVVELKPSFDLEVPVSIEGMHLQAPEAKNSSIKDDDK